MVTFGVTRPVGSDCRTRPKRRGESYVVQGKDIMRIAPQRRQKLIIRENPEIGGFYQKYRGKTGDGEC